MHSVSNIQQSINNIYTNVKKSDEKTEEFSILSEEVGFMLEEKDDNLQNYESIFSQETKRQAKINKTKIENESNQYSVNNLPDELFYRIKNSFGENTEGTFVQTGHYTSPVKDGLSGGNASKWLTTVFTLNAIAMSGGQNDMMINQDNVNWLEVLDSTSNFFKSNLDRSHTEEVGQHYREYLDNPQSQYYFYSDTDKDRLVEQFQKENYELNTLCYSAAEYLRKDLEATA